jgi:glutathione S-transferase
MGDEAPLPRLITLAPSHFGHKARWALERYDVAYAHEPHAPGFHVPAVQAAGKTTGTSTPVLVVPGSPPGSPPQVLPDSAAILRWVDARLPPNAPRLFPPAAEAEAEALCTRFDAGLGVAARAFVYAHALDSAEIAAALAPPGLPTSERFAWRFLGVGYAVRGLMRRGMGISPESGVRALEQIRSEFAAVDAVLADGRRFLCGDAAGFTAADLTFAALAAPALGVPYGEHPPWASVEALPAPLRDVAMELRDTAAGRFALRLWEEERSRVVVGGAAAQAPAAEQPTACADAA